MLQTALERGLRSSVIKLDSGLRRELFVPEAMQLGISKASVFADLFGRHVVCCGNSSAVSKRTGRLPGDFLAVVGMHDRELTGMQLQPISCVDGHRIGIERITKDRMSCHRQMQSDLMRPAGDWLNGEPCGTAVRLEEPPAGL